MKDLGLLVFRILLVALFPISAYYKIIQWPAIATVLDKAGAPFATYVAGIGTGVELVFPFLVILGLWTRPAAAGLILYTLAATYIGHPFWKVPPEAYFMQLMSFMKNMSIIGALIALMAVGPGRIALRPDRD
jgi:putative oxidoreductase